MLIPFLVYFFIFLTFVHPRYHSTTCADEDGDEDWNPDNGSESDHGSEDDDYMSAGADIDAATDADTNADLNVDVDTGEDLGGSELILIVTCKNHHTSKT